MRDVKGTHLNQKGRRRLIGQGLALSLVLGAFLAVGAGNGAFAEGPAVMGVNLRGDGSIPPASGASEDCLAVSVGEIFDVDIYVANVVELFAWELPFVYNPSVLEVTQHDVLQFLAANPGSSVVNASEPTPDRDGLLFLGSADIGNRPETGSGVLARLTLLARNPGVSTAKVGLLDFNGDGRPDLGPRLTSADGKPIGDQAGDGYLDGPLLGGRIAVDVGCDAPLTEPASTSQPPSQAPPAEGQPSAAQDLVEQLLASAPPLSISDSQMAAVAGDVTEPSGTDGAAGGSAGDTPRRAPDDDGDGGSWLVDPLWLLAVLVASSVGGAAAVGAFLMRSRTRRG